MRKFLMIMFLMIGFSLSSFAEIQWYKSTSFASATINEYTGRYTWSDWEKSSVNIKFDLNKDVITIYSPTTQYYYVYDVTQATNDGQGGTYVKFYVVDGERDKGTIRLRIESNGNSQLYVDFSNVAWVYNVVRIQ